MLDLAPVLTGCHVCRSPLIDLINRRMAEGMSDTDISKWLSTEGQYVSRITLGKHKREHLTTEHEGARIRAAEILKKQQGTIKFKGDLASLVQSQVISLVEAGHLTPTLAEGLRAQEIIDRRQEKSSDRELTLALAGILGGAPLLEGTIVDVTSEPVSQGNQYDAVSGEVLLVDDGRGVPSLEEKPEDRSTSSASVSDPYEVHYPSSSLVPEQL
jgi:hypothetical protein